jgi:hypothetical protein
MEVLWDGTSEIRNNNKNVSVDLVVESENLVSSLVGDEERRNGM